MNIFKYLLLLFASSSLFAMDPPKPEKFSLHFFGQVHSNSIWGGLLLSFFEQGLNTLNEKDTQSYLKLRSDHEETLRSQIEIFHRLSDLLKRYPNTRVYVEGLPIGPHVFGGELEAKISAAFAHIDFDALTETQKIYLIGCGAAHILHNLGTIDKLYGMEDPLFSDENSEIFNYVHLPLARESTPRPKRFKAKRASQTESSYSFDLCAAASIYIRKKREDFVLENIIVDADLIKSSRAILILGLNHKVDIKTKVNSGIGIFIDELPQAESKKTDHFVTPFLLQKQRELNTAKKDFKQHLITYKKDLLVLFPKLKDSLTYESLFGNAIQILEVEINHLELILKTSEPEKWHKNHDALNEKKKALLLYKAAETSSTAEEFAAQIMKPLLSPQ